MYDDLRALLKKSGASLTTPRKAVFDALLRLGPSSVNELIKQTTPQADRASIYRTLELFEKLGITHRVNIGFKYKVELSDVFSGHHHHFYCTNCGQSFDLKEHAMLETMIDSTVAKEGFSPRGHQLEVYGLCEKCRS